MPDQVTIRRATNGDATSLEALIAAHATYERSAPTYANVGNLALRLQEAGRLWCWVAVDANSNELVGYASATEDVATFTGRSYGHMDCLFVVDTHRGARIGHDLLQTVTTWSRSRGHGELQWQTPDWNIKAQEFYRRHGATAAPKVRFSLALEVGRC